LGKADNGPQFTLPDDYDEDDFSADELEQTEENVTDRASAASTIREMEERGVPVHINTIQARQWLLDRGVKLEE
jgi:hypothetical protein